MLEDILKSLKSFLGGKSLASKTQRVKASFFLSPLRLSAGTSDYVLIKGRVENLGRNPTFVSLEFLGGQLGFDPSGITKRKEMWLGEVKPGESREITVPLYSTPATKPGIYKVKVRLNLHYGEEREAVFYTSDYEIQVRAV